MVRFHLLLQEISLTEEFIPDKNKTIVQLDYLLRLIRLIVGHLLFKQRKTEHNRHRSQSVIRSMEGHECSKLITEVRLLYRRHCSHSIMVLQGTLNPSMMVQFHLGTQCEISSYRQSDFFTRSMRRVQVLHLAQS